jgi:hypothetical protein
LGKCKARNGKPVASPKTSTENARLHVLHFSFCKAAIFDNVLHTPGSISYECYSWQKAFLLSLWQKPPV